MKTCYYCGTKYPETDERCPLCGQTETEPEEVDEVPVALREEPQTEEPKRSRRDEKAVKKQQKKNPAKKGGAFSTILCIVLALAVIAGALFILESLGLVSILPKPADETTVSLPETDEPIACTGVSVTPETINFTNGGQKQMLTITVKPANCTEELLCEVADPGVVTVSPEGEVTSLGEGETEITVTCGEFAASVRVTCLFTAATPDPVQDTPAPDTTQPEPQPDTTAQPSGDMKLSNTDFTFFQVGETTKLTVDGADGATVVWSSSDPTVASVDGGKVTAVAPGMATITARVGDKELKAVARCQFEAPSAPAEQQPAQTTGSVHISLEDVTLKTEGETFTVSLWDGDSRVSGVSWSTSNGAVASVSDSGKVTAVGPGMATVTGAYNGASYKCIVRCSF